jgi:hypothetical protein
MVVVRPFVRCSSRRKQQCPNVGFSDLEILPAEARGAFGWACLTSLRLTPPDGCPSNANQLFLHLLRSNPSSNRSADVTSPQMGKEKGRLFQQFFLPYADKTFYIVLVF